MGDQTSQFIQSVFVREKFKERPYGLWSMGDHFKGQILEKITLGIMAPEGKFQVHFIFGHMAQFDDFSISHYSLPLLESWER